MGLDVHAGLILGIPVTVGDFFDEEGAERSCINRHQYPADADFDYCQKCGERLKVRKAMILKPYIKKLKRYDELQSNLRMDSYGHDGEVRVYQCNAMQTCEDNDQPFCLGIRLAYTDSHRNYNNGNKVEAALLNEMPPLVDKINEEARLLEILPGRTFRLYSFCYLSY